MSKPTLAERVIVYAAGDIEAYRRLSAAARGRGVRPSSSALYIQSEARQDIAFHLPGPSHLRDSLDLCLRSMWGGEGMAAPHDEHRALGGDLRDRLTAVGFFTTAF